MIRQAKTWDGVISKLSEMERDKLLAELADKQKEYKETSDTLSENYKSGKITFIEMSTQTKAAYVIFETYALSVGYYEDVVLTQSTEAVN